MAKAEKKSKTVTEYTLTLTEQEARLLFAVIGKCVHWSESPGSRNIYEALRGVGLEYNTPAKCSYVERIGMFQVEVD